jgi:hypothetical protein
LFFLAFEAATATLGAAIPSQDLPLSEEEKKGYAATIIFSMYHFCYVLCVPAAKLKHRCSLLTFINLYLIGYIYLKTSYHI